MGAKFPLQSTFSKANPDNDFWREEIVFKEDLLYALKKKRKENTSDKETDEAIRKIEDQKRLTSEEFIRIYDAIRRDGPISTYKTPDNWSQVEKE